jgi:hypothetical protein
MSISAEKDSVAMALSVQFGLANAQLIDSEGVYFCNPKLNHICICCIIYAIKILKSKR